MGDDLTYEQLLAMLQGKYSESVAKGGVMNAVGAKGLDTPAERDFLTGGDSDNGVMDVATNFKNDNVTKDYTFDVDGQTQGYTFGGDAPLSEEAIQNMRNIQGITADGQMMPNTTNLGLGAEIGAAAETNFLENTMGNNFAGTGEANMDVDRQSFNTNFANLDDAQKARVTEMMAGMTPEQKKAFALGMTGKKGAGRLSGYEVENYNRLAY
jgi:hypothetical protein|tara:strand:+ start:635 stop:1267 length:633 start_codon:yes stop_codon:yes gene_type:complete